MPTVKTIRHHYPRFRKLVYYVLDDRGRADLDGYPPIFHNMPSHDPEQIIAAFHQNDTFRRKRKNGVVFYHEIISFSPKDRQSASDPELLRAVSQHYIQIRGNNALCLAQAHVHNQNIHIHLLFSGTLRRSATTLRLNNKEFKRIRQELESFVRERFPTIEHSFVYERWDRKKDSKIHDLNKRTSDERYMRQRDTNSTSDKQTIRDLLEQLAEGLPTPEDFFKVIEQHSQLDLYRYRGRINGVIYNGRSYRFNRLRAAPHLTQTVERLRELDDLSRKSERIKEQVKIRNTSPSK